MTRTRRRIAAVLPVLLVATVTAVVVRPDPALAAGGPSVPLPQTPSTPVAPDRMASRPPDQASQNALTGDQPAGGGAQEGSGTVRATSLSPSATWEVSARTGDFTWSYPLRVPPAPGGLEPDLALGYASSTVDGRTSATNNQTSWVGEGWDLSPGFIERTYLSCVDDTMGGTTPPRVGDLCWRSDNAIASFDGGGGQVVCCDGDGRWRLRGDDGSRVERLTGAANGDDDGEHWKITTVDGTQYHFGSRPEAKSTWTVPVFGDDPGEPCHGAAFDSSHCVQAWRWNLDKVVDRHGNTMLYAYEPETNSYGLNLKDAAVPYVRGGTLRAIDYGVRDGLPAAGRVVFAVADRCVPGSTCTPDRKQNWPDVPWDERCDTATCADRYSPSFWSTKRLTKITTQARRGDAFSDVDSWALDQQFPDPGDGGKATLWLKGIVHTGHVGGTAALPAVRFEGTRMANRVHKVDGVASLVRYRVTGVVSESGGALSVVYAPPDCVDGTSMPANPETNTLRCYPATWKKKDYADRTDYFHKYVVAQVTQNDHLGTSTEQVTRYEYLDGAAWHFDTSEFTRDEKRTWDDFRGYARVLVRTGTATDPAGPVGKVEKRFYRGMNGDRLPAGSRTVTVRPTEGAARPDEDWLQGVELETLTYDGDSDRVVGKTVNDPTWQGPTATRGGLKAYIVRTGAQNGHTALAAGGWRTTRTEFWYDDRGLLIRANDLGDTATAADDRCIHTTYKRNTGRWLLSLPSRVETVGVSCGATPSFPGDAISDARTAYDGQGFDAAPTTGDATVIQIARERPAAGPVYVTTETHEYDAHGRVVKSTDARDGVTTTAYTPALGGPTTQTVVTNPLGHTVTTALEPAWGVDAKVTDPNKRVTESAFDPLGRTVAVWLANRPRATNREQPSTRYAYLIRNDDVSVVTTTSVGPNGNYTTKKELYDGLLRPRQTQEPAVGGGRLLTDTRYDSHGRAYKTTQPFFNSVAPDDTLWVASDTEVAGLTVTRFDGAGRESAEIYYGGAQEKWRTTTAYGGDRVHVTPPLGGTATTTISDARGRTVELRQYRGGTPSSAYDATRYTYTDADRLASTTDPAGNAWRFEYDLRGNQTRADDPDKGVTTMTYDAAGDLATSTDARGVTLAYDHDLLGRKASVKSGATLLAEWRYDTATKGKGQLAASTRFTGGYAYTRAVASYTALYEPYESTLTIPESEQTLTGSYTTYRTFNDDGTPYGQTLPAIGDLPTETVSHGYDDLANPTTLTGGPAGGGTSVYVADTRYTRYREVARVELGETGKRVWQSFYYDDSTRRLDRTIVDAELPRPMQADASYRYDPAGNVRSITDTPQDLPADVQCFRYDHLRRLTDAWTPGGDCAPAPATATLAGPAPYWQSFTYDAVGNRLTETQHAASGDTVRMRTYAYPTAGAHRLASVTTTVAGGAATTDRYGYDAAGNTTDRTLTGGAQRLSWDEFGRLSKVTEGARATEYVYDADGNRLVRRDPTGSTLYLDGQELRLDKATGRLTGTRYYEHGDNVVAMRTASGVTWLAGDHQDTARLAIDSGTQKVAQRRQLPFGGPRGTASAFPGERGFVGGIVDASTGLTNLGARLYDPALGRFISVDPVMDLADAQQMHGYTYSNSNPVTFADPTGMLWGWLKKAVNVVTDVAKHAAPVLGVAAMVLGAATPIGMAAALGAIAFGAINAAKNCSGGGSWLDCAMDVAGMAPVVGRLAVGAVRSARIAADQMLLRPGLPRALRPAGVGNRRARLNASAELAGEQARLGRGPLFWAVGARTAGRTGAAADATALVAGTEHYLACDLVGFGYCPEPMRAPDVVQPFADVKKPKPIPLPAPRRKPAGLQAKWVPYGFVGPITRDTQVHYPPRPVGVPDNRGNYVSGDGRLCNTGGRACAS